MKSATLRVTILTATLLSCAAGMSYAAGVSEAKPQAGGAPVAITQSAAGENADDGAHALSTLGALALGIIGLLWARRHTAEL